VKLLAAVFALLALTAGSTSAAGNACPATNPPNELVLVGGSGQQAQLGKPFSESLRVALANANGCPVTGNLAGVTVEFDAPGSGPSGVFSSTGSHSASVGTDSQGVATAPQLTANHTTGNWSVTASSTYGSVSISVSNTANGLPAAIAATGTSSQSAAVNAQYAQTLQARVTDADGNPVQGAAVSFSIVPGPTGAGASFLGGQPQATTDSDGIATSPPLLANGSAGRFAAVASTDGLASVATFSLDNHAATTTLAALAHDPAATVNTQYRERLVARVLDANGQPVEGATVTFGVDAAGGSFVGGGTQATALSDANGIATAPALVASKTAGTFTATATAPGAQPVRYALTNRAGAPYAIVAGAASGTATTVGSRVAIPLAVTVTDKDGNAVPHATVVFAAPKHGASGTFGKARRAHARTNAKGIAVAPTFTANGTVGGYIVTATVHEKCAAFALSNLPRA
jgi:protocatechuate 3,4-dioxygenase beta subunit